MDNIQQQRTQSGVTQNPQQIGGQQLMSTDPLQNTNITNQQTLGVTAKSLSVQSSCTVNCSGSVTTATSQQSASNAGWIVGFSLVLLVVVVIAWVLRRGAAETIAPVAAPDSKQKDAKAAVEAQPEPIDTSETEPAKKSATKKPKTGKRKKRYK